jgi:hypothetical protein
VTLNQHQAEFFAAYVELRSDCEPKETIKELTHKGADFIFLDPKNYPNFDANLLTNVYAVPVFFIKHTSQDFFQLNEANKRNISIFFKLPEKNVYGHTELDFFYVPSSPLTHRFVKMAVEVKKRLQSKVLFNPVIFTFSSKSQEFIKSNCVSKGEFCAYDPDNEGKLTGRDVILEAIRQKCIFKTHPESFLAYLDLYFQKCLNKMTLECSKGLMASLSVDSASIQNCFDKSFTHSETNQLENFNELLEDDRQMRKNIGVTQFPDFYINGVMYAGSLDMFDLLLSICSTEAQEDSFQCKNIDMTPDLDESYASIIVVNLAIFVVCLVFLVYFIRTKMKDKFKKEVKKAIDNYMTEYSAIKEEGSQLA